MRAALHRAANSQVYMFLITRDSATGIYVMPFGEPPDLKDIEKSLGLQDATPTCFDVRRAVCSQEADHALLSAVLDAYPGGIRRFEVELIRALAQGEEQWTARPPIKTHGGAVIVRIEPS